MKLGDRRIPISLDWKHLVLIITQMYKSQGVTQIVLTRADNGLDFGRFSYDDVERFTTEEKKS